MARVLRNKNSISAVTAKIIGIILKMPFEQRCQLLSFLSKTQGLNSRKYVRKDCLMNVQYLASEQLHNGFIYNISSRGAFIECSKDALQKMFFGQSVTLTFDHPDRTKHIKTTGEVARIADSGFAISFDDFLQGMDAAA